MSLSTRLGYLYQLCDPIGKTSCQNPRIHPESPVHLAPAPICDLADAGRSDWYNLEEIDVPLRQHNVLRPIDQACYDHILAEASDACSKFWPFLALTLMLVTGRMLSPYLHDWEFRLFLQCSFRSLP